jgi:hypothetical protein
MPVHQMTKSLTQGQPTVFKAAKLNVVKLVTFRRVQREVGNDIAQAPWHIIVV